MIRPIACFLKYDSLNNWRNIRLKGFKMTKYVILFLSMVIAIGLSASLSQAQTGEPRLLAKYDDWDAYMFIENGHKVCYMISQPVDSQGEYSKRGEIYALITHRPAEGTRDVFSYITGYSYKVKSDASIKVDNNEFSLFTQNETAWAYDAKSDKSITDAIRNGSEMVVKGTSARGTLTTDHFSLKGSSKAYARISSEC